MKRFIYAFLLLCVGIMPALAQTEPDVPKAVQEIQMQAVKDLLGAVWDYGSTTTATDEEKLWDKTKTFLVDHRMERYERETEWKERKSILVKFLAGFSNIARESFQAGRPKPVFRLEPATSKNCPAYVSESARKTSYVWVATTDTANGVRVYIWVLRTVPEDLDSLDPFSEKSWKVVGVGNITPAP